MLCRLTPVQQMVAPYAGRKLVSTVCPENVISQEQRVYRDMLFVTWWSMRHS